MRPLSLNKNDPLYQDIKLVVCSEAGYEIMKAAALRGEPALCSLDAVLCAELGLIYVNAERGSTAAGAMISDVMRKLGYKRGAVCGCPLGYRIKAATLWTKPDC